MRSGDVPVPAALGLLAEPVRWRLLRELAGSDRRVRELVAALDEPQNLVSYHLRRLREGGLVTSRRSNHDARDVYYGLDPTRCADALAGAAAAIHPGLSLVPAAAALPSRPGAARVLFACTGNSARSPMAAAILDRLAPPGRVRAASAGTRPKPIHPAAVRVVRERYGIDLAAHRPTPLDRLTRQRFDYLITLCDRARERCPDFRTDPRHVHWSLPDPAAGGRSIAPFLRLADSLETRLRFELPRLLARPGDHAAAAGRRRG